MPRTVTTRLTSATRLGNTVNGNPRYDLHTHAGVYRVQSDSAIALEVDNLLGTIARARRANREQEGPLPYNFGIPVTLHLTRAGRVWNITED